MMTKNSIFSIAAFLTVTLTACSGSGGGGGGSSTAGAAITQDWQAEAAVETMAEYAIGRVLDDLPRPNGTKYSSTVVSGDSGTATVSGSVRSNRTSTSTSVSTSYVADIVVRFSNYKVAWTSSGADTITLTGTVRYVKSISSTQIGLSYRSSRFVSTSGAKVQVHLHYSDSNTNDIVDTITFQAKGKSDSLLTGTVQTQHGSYPF